MQYNSKWSDRRTATGSLKPFMFLSIELTALLMVCWLVSLFDILFITILVSLGVIYFFMSSSLLRYKKVKKRQIYSNIKLLIATRD